MSKNKALAARLISGRASIKIRKLLTGLLISLFLISLCYVILFPFLAKLSSALMSETDLYDSSVSLVPKDPTTDNILFFIRDSEFIQALLNTVLFAVVVSVLSVFSSVFVGYGLARYKFRTAKLWLLLLIFTMLVPNITIAVPLYASFRYFDIFGIIKLLTGGTIRLTETVIPVALLSATSLGFRGGIFSVLMRQYFAGVPTELSEAAFIDGAGHFKTFFKVMLPMAKAMMTVIFLLSFSWQWTDSFYSTVLSATKPMLSNKILVMMHLNTSTTDMYLTVVRANTGALLTIIPLLVIYLIFQRKIVEGIERAGLTG